MSEQKTNEETMERLKYLASRLRQSGQPTSSSSSIQHETELSQEDSPTLGVFRFLDLPVEVAVQILKNVDGIEIARFQTLCKACHELVRDSLELQYAIECSVCGVVDGPSSAPYSLRERFQRLQRWKQAWDRADFGDPIAINGGQAHLVWIRTSGSTFVYYSRPEAQRRFEFHRMASQLRGTSMSTWTLNDIPPFQEFAFDDDSDLLVLLSGYEGRTTLDLCLLTCSTGERHPKAYGDNLVIDSQIVISEPAWSPCIIISGDLVGVRSMHGQRREERSHWHIEIWVCNWKTGDTLLNIAEERFYEAAFDFLDDQYIIATGIDECRQHLYVYDCYTFPRGRMSISESAGYASLVLRLPGTTARRSYETVSVHTNPGRPTARDSSISTRLPFNPTRRNAVVRVTVVAAPSTRAPRWEHFDLIIPAKTILARAGIYTRGPVSPIAPIPWHEWGEEARLLGGADYTSRVLVYGSRFAVHGTWLPGFGHQDQRRIAIYDFDTFPSMLRDINRTLGEATNREQVLLSVFPWSEFTGIGDVWAEDVATSAPCRATLTDITSMSGEWMTMIEDGIILQKLNPQSERYEPQVYTI